MPTAPVNKDGAALYYEDSGAPSSSDYVTIIMLHGAVFHGAVFRRLFPYAGASNLRIVLINSRDYPGSSWYTDAEIEKFRGPPEVQASTLVAHALEFQTFIAWFIDTHNTPPIAANEDGSLSGGVAFLAWSAGNMQSLSLLAHADKASEKVRLLLEAHLRAFIMYAPSPGVIGAQTHPGVYNPFGDETLAPAEQLAAFFPCVCAHYTDTELTPDAEAFEAALVARKKLDIMPTYERMSPEELENVVDRRERPQTHVPLGFIDLTLHQDIARRALYDCCGEGSASPGASEPIWPRVRVCVLLPSRDVGHVVWAVELLRRQYEEARKAGKIGRTVDVVRIDGANHFVHWEEPERFVKLVASVV
ncbi:uncharacterized protein FIBRA_01570 [Fibroporia radiculosa]|uniref:AB hydrolase-1 domain-containing protein n=1 Tax=Fibroporia radiculosa TaxID=599839 RepID=J4HTJ6_9APHY|nr:uncharacterized protein FIBRA_01570 [Fibroporia radiculosa]CCL99552.1 predicted protein [Fibroporia radiculosa]